MMTGDKVQTYHSPYPSVAAFGVVLKMWKEMTLNPNQNTMQQYALGEIMAKVPNRHEFNNLVMKMAEYKPIPDIDVEDQEIAPRYQATEAQRDESRRAMNMIQNFEAMARQRNMGGGIGGLQMQNFQQPMQPAFRFGMQ